MRTTVDLDDDILQAAKELAAIRKVTLGKILSALARAALQPPRPETKIRDGVPLLTPGPNACVVSLDTVNDLRDDDEGGIL